MFRGKKKEQEDPITYYVRNRIREARAQSGMSQADLAKFVYKSGSAVSDIERGRVQVSVNDLALIAAAVEKPASFFFPPNVRGAEQGTLEPDEQELVQHYRQLGNNTALKKLARRRVKELADLEFETYEEEYLHDAEQDKMDKMAE